MRKTPFCRRNNSLLQITPRDEVTHSHSKFIESVLFLSIAPMSLSSDASASASDIAASEPQQDPQHNNVLQPRKRRKRQKDLSPQEARQAEVDIAQKEVGTYERDILNLIVGELERENGVANATYAQLLNNFRRRMRRHNESILKVLSALCGIYKRLVPINPDFITTIRSQITFITQQLQTPVAVQTQPVDAPAQAEMADAPPPPVDLMSVLQGYLANANQYLHLLCSANNQQPSQHDQQAPSVGDNLPNVDADVAALPLGSSAAPQQLADAAHGTSSCSDAI